MAISSPPPGKIAGLNPSEGGERYIPLGSNDPDLGPYLVYLKERILKFWRTPGGAKDLKGHVDMAFTVKRDGKVSNIQVMSSSGYTLLDQGVMAAINRAAPFRPIPEKIREKKLLLLGTFSYNQALRQKASQ
jgi:protein TonB